MTARSRRSWILISVIGGVVALTPAPRRAAHAQRADATPLFVPHPDDPSKHVEYFEALPSGPGPWPVLVFLHGQQDAPSDGGRVFVTSGTLDGFARRNMLAVGVSLPGYGGSSGPDDFAGPFAVHGVEAVLRALRDSKLARADKIVIEGVSLGAMTAGMLAADDTTLAGVIMISGEYDLLAALRHPRAMPAWMLAMRNGIRLTGRGGLASRSVLTVARRIKSPVLLINGAMDDRTDPAHASHLAAAIDSAGGHARFVLVPDYGHRIPPEVRARIVDPFLAAVLGARAP